MTDTLPRQHIPDEWAAQAHCPVCRASALRVQRASSQPDQMLCGRCGTAFMVEQSGPRLRVTRWPPPLIALLQTVSSEWLTVAEIKALVQKAKPPQPAPLPPIPPTSAPESTPPSVAESASPSNLEAVIERAQKLYALGNRLMVIEASLKNSGATSEEIQAALEVVRGLDEQNRRGQQNRLRLASAVALASLVMVLMLAVVNNFTRRPTAPASAPIGTSSGPATNTPVPYNPVIGLINNFLPTGAVIVNGPSPTPGPRLFIFPTQTPELISTPGGPTFTPGPTRGNDSGLPDWVLTAAPPGVKIVDVPTPSVERGVGPGGSPCPLTADEAATLFGGKKDYWAYASQQNGWTLIVADAPITITIPANMTAGYLVVGSSLYMTSVTGPATIRNVNFGAVSCE